MQRAKAQQRLRWWRHWQAKQRLCSQLCSAAASTKALQQATPPPTHRLAVVHAVAEGVLVRKPERVCEVEGPQPVAQLALEGRVVGELVVGAALHTCRQTAVRAAGKARQGGRRRALCLMAGWELGQVGPHAPELHTSCMVRSKSCSGAQGLPAFLPTPVVTSMPWGLLKCVGAAPNEQHFY